MSATPAAEQPPGFDEDKLTTLANDDDFRNNYAFCTTWADILEPHGWVSLGSDSRGELWEPPGRSGRHTPGAAVSHKRGPLTVFTTSTKFEAGSYSKFDAYAVLNHDGDRRAAAQALHSQRFGVFRKQDIDGNQIVRCKSQDGRKTLSYTWPADREPLSVGDTVELPPPAPADARKIYGDQPRQTKVTHLGSYFSGQPVRILRLVKRASPDDPT